MLGGIPADLPLPDPSMVITVGGQFYPVPNTYSEELQTTADRRTSMASWQAGVESRIQLMQKVYANQPRATPCLVAPRSPPVHGPPLTVNAHNPAHNPAHTARSHCPLTLPAHTRCIEQRGRTQ